MNRSIIVLANEIDRVLAVNETRWIHNHCIQRTGLTRYRVINGRDVLVTVGGRSVQAAQRQLAAWLLANVPGGPAYVRTTKTERVLAALRTDPALASWTERALCDRFDCSAGTVKRAKRIAARA